jgi:hypothetical protein
MPVTQNQRPPGADIVNESVAVRVIDQTALTAFDKQWISTHRFASPHRAVNPSGDYFQSFLKKRLGVCKIHFIQLLSVAK